MLTGIETWVVEPKKQEVKVHRHFDAVCGLKRIDW
jgi:hypothetical protein